MGCPLWSRFVGAILITLSLVMVLMPLNYCVSATSSSDWNNRGLLTNWLHEITKQSEGTGIFLHPVILTPGYMGSQLEVTLDRNWVRHPGCIRKSNRPLPLWLSMLNHQPTVDDCWFDNIRLTYDPDKRVTFGDQGVSIGPVGGMGSLSGIEYISPMGQQTSISLMYGEMVNRLIEMGYKRGENIRGAPYDWRKSPQEQTEFFLTFKKLVEETYQENGEKPVVLIAHSMGCMFNYMFLQRQSTEWKDKYIKGWIPIAGPLGGTFRYLYVYIGADDYPASMLSRVRLAERTFPAVSFLMPKEFTYGDQVLVETRSINYTARNYESLFINLNISDSMMDTWKMVKLDDITEISSPGRFEIHCMGGIGTATRERVIVDGDLDGSRSFRYKMAHGEGDGFVNINSFRQCVHLKGEGNFSVTEFPLDHMQMIQHPTPLNYVSDILSRMNSESAQQTKLPKVPTSDSL